MPKDHPDFTNPIQLGGNVINGGVTTTVPGGGSNTSPVFDVSSVGQVFIQLSNDVIQNGQYFVQWTTDPAGSVVSFTSPTFFTTQADNLALVLAVIAPFFKVNRNNQGVTTEHFTTTVIGFTTDINARAILTPQAVTQVSDSIAANGNEINAITIQTPGPANLSAVGVPSQWRVDLESWNGISWNVAAAIGNTTANSSDNRGLILPFTECRLNARNLTGTAGVISRCLVAPG